MPLFKELTKYEQDEIIREQYLFYLWQFNAPIKPREPLLKNGLYGFTWEIEEDGTPVLIGSSDFKPLRAYKVDVRKMHIPEDVCELEAMLQSDAGTIKVVIYTTVPKMETMSAVEKAQRVKGVMNFYEKNGEPQIAKEAKLKSMFGLDAWSEKWFEEKSNEIARNVNKQKLEIEKEIKRNVSPWIEESKKQVIEAWENEKYKEIIRKRLEKENHIYE